MSSTPRHFPEQLKVWRARTGISQLDLSLRCGVSQRHISFLELGRASPSRSMVLTICDALDIPLRERNDMLLLAGFAPAYGESDLSAPELAAVERAMMMMLDNHDPFPAVVLDRSFNVVRANKGAKRLQLWLYDCQHEAELPDEAGNYVRGLFAEGGYRHHIRNWEECAQYLLRSIRTEALADLPVDLRQKLQDQNKTFAAKRRQPPDQEVSPLLTIDLQKRDERLRFFATSTMLNAPMNVTLQEMVIQSCFPADEATRAFVETM